MERSHHSSRDLMAREVQGSSDIGTWIGVPMKTVLITLCSALKTRGGETKLPQDNYSIPIIEEVRKRAQPEILKLHPNAILENKYRPAYERYSGGLYSAAREALREMAKSEETRVLIASGFYGLLDFREHILNYELDIDAEVSRVWRDSGLPRAATEILNSWKDYQRLFVLTSRYKELLGEAYSDGFVIQPSSSFDSASEYMRFLGGVISHLHSSGRLTKDLGEVAGVETKVGAASFRIVGV